MSVKMIQRRACAGGLPSSDFWERSRPPEASRALMT